jgi:predicted DNA binding CopG/RHH family protein
MKKNQLDKEEKELLDAFESGEFQSNLTASRKKFIEESAAQTFKKDKRINIRLSGRDLIAIQKRALEEGIPYQTLVSSIIHKYASGSLYDVPANKIQ